MNIQAELLRVGGALGQPIQNAKAAWSERQGILLTLRDDNGAIGLGEASPLPGYSPDSLEECWLALERVPWERAMALLGEEAPLAGLVRLREFIPSTLPAARFAAETALADLAARRAGVPLFAWLTGSREKALSSRTPRRLSRLLAGTSRADNLRLAEGAFEQGLRTFKLKLTSDVEADLDTLGALRKRLGPQVALRCDANQSLELSHAEELLPRLLPLKLEFLEEPVETVHLSRLASPVPLALDESLRAPEAVLSQAFAHPALSAVVLKPMVLGGFSACAEWANRVGSSHAVLLSHLFDGPVALAACAHAALAWGSRDLAMGLDLHAGLAVWSGARIASITEGAIHPVPEPGLGLAWSTRP